MRRLTDLTAVIGVLVLALAAGCGSDGSGAERSGLVDDTPGLVRPGVVHLDQSIDTARAKQIVRTAQRLYTFWDTGKTFYLDQAVSDSFTDNTLPPDRPQGPAGPAAASEGFRAAVPDLTCELAGLYVVGDTFTARLVFRGHFTGTYNGVRGRGQTIEFNAIDIQHVGAGQKITEDWHLEDNRTFLQQADLVTIAGVS